MRMLIISSLLFLIMGCAATSNDVPDVQSAHMQPTKVDANTAKLQQATTF